MQIWSADIPLHHAGSSNPRLTSFPWQLPPISLTLDALQLHRLLLAPKTQESTVQERCAMATHEGNHGLIHCPAQRHIWRHSKVFWRWRNHLLPQGHVLGSRAERGCPAPAHTCTGRWARAEAGAVCVWRCAAMQKHVCAEADAALCSACVP